jgi:hypothetical protein
MNQSLVGSVVIGAEFGREDHGSITATAFGKKLKSLTARTRHELWTTIYGPLSLGTRG